MARGGGGEGGGGGETDENKPPTNPRKPPPQLPDKAKTPSTALFNPSIPGPASPPTPLL